MASQRAVQRICGVRGCFARKKLPKLHVVALWLPARWTSPGLPICPPCRDPPSNDHRLNKVMATPVASGGTVPQDGGGQSP